MRISVNLATRPYVELRPFFLRLRVIMGALVVGGIVVAVVTHSMQQKLNVSTAQMDRLKQRTSAAQMEKQQNERRMHQPQNAAVLNRAHFLNLLFLRKSFSWTAVMMDLENVLPSGVQVTSIEPQVSADGDVTIRLRVSGERDRAILLVRNLERSKRFIEPKLTNESTQAKQASNLPNRRPVNDGAPAGVEFEIMARYNPLPEGENYAKPKKVAAEKTGSEIGSIPHHNPHPANGKYPPNGVVLRPYQNPVPRPLPRPGAPGVPGQGGPR